MIKDIINWFPFRVVFCVGTLVCIVVGLALEYMWAKQKGAPLGMMLVGIVIFMIMMLVC